MIRHQQVTIHSLMPKINKDITLRVECWWQYQLTSFCISKYYFLIPLFALHKIYENKGFLSVKFCPYTGEYGSVKTCILASFIQCRIFITEPYAYSTVIFLVYQGNNILCCLYHQILLNFRNISESSREKFS